MGQICFSKEQNKIKIWAWASYIRIDTGGWLDDSMNKKFVLAVSQLLYHMLKIKAALVSLTTHATQSIGIILAFRIT